MSHTICAFREQNLRIKKQYADLQVFTLTYLILEKLILLLLCFKVSAATVCSECYESFLISTPFGSNYLFVQLKQLHC